MKHSTKKMAFNLISRAREIIIDQDRWTSKYPAEAENGVETFPVDDLAIKWSASGAFERACHDHFIEAGDLDLNEAEDLLRFVSESRKAALIAIGFALNKSETGVGVDVYDIIHGWDTEDTVIDALGHLGVKCGHRKSLAVYNIALDSIEDKYIQKYV